ncbi:hypothetical protein AVEN_6317-1, partial [Araneus ventricosus]
SWSGLRLVLDQFEAWVRIPRASVPRTQCYIVSFYYVSYFFPEVSVAKRSSAVLAQSFRRGSDPTAARVSF